MRDQPESLPAAASPAPQPAVREVERRVAAVPGPEVAGALLQEMLGTILAAWHPGARWLRQDFRYPVALAAGDLVRARLALRPADPAAATPSRVPLWFDCAATNERGESVLEGTAEAAVVPPLPDGTAPVRTERHRHYEQLIAIARGAAAIPTAIAHPCDEVSLGAALAAAAEGLIAPLFVGPEARIRAAAAQAGLDLGAHPVIDAPHSHAAAAAAVALVRAGRAELLMKGSLHTDELMHEVTAHDTGLRTERRISHIYIMDVPTHPEPLFITDAAVNIFPDLETKADIIRNAIDLFTGLGLGRPLVGILSAVETVTPKIPSTIEAAALCKMAERGQIAGATLDGPLAFDNAISPQAARIKGILSPVAGHAQILVVPDLEAGNMLAKNLSFLAEADAAGIVMGARVPIILTSRADSPRTRMASIAVAVLYAHRRRAGLARASV